MDGPITQLLTAAAAVRYDHENAHGVVNALTPEGEVIERVPEFYRRTSGFLRLDYRSPSRTDKAILTYKFKNKSDRNHFVGGFNLPEHGEDAFDHENEIKLNQSHMGSTMLNQFSLTSGRNGQI